MIRREELQKINGLRHDGGTMVSVYLALSPNGQSDHNITLKNMLRDASEQQDQSGNREQQTSLQSLLDDIRDLVRDNAGQFGQAVALFANPDDGIVKELAIPGSVESTVTIGDSASISPLVQFVEENPVYCTCIIARDHAQVFLGQGLAVTEHESLVDDEVPGQHDQGGWSQSRYERHIEDHVHRHYKRVADLLFELHEQKKYELLILGGPEEVVSGFRSVLHQYVQDAIVGEIRLLAEANINDVAEHSHDAVQSWLESDKQRVIDTIQGEAMAEDLGVLGLNDTIAALQRGQVMNLAVARDVHSSGIVCEDCGAIAIFSDANNACPYCGGKVRDVENILPTLIENAFAQGASVTIIRSDSQREQFAALGGVGALLRFRIDEQLSQ